MAAMNKWYAIVDFVEEHGGSLSGEQRHELLSFIREYAEAINDDPGNPGAFCEHDSGSHCPKCDADAGSILEASNG
jgi:hypothetical protein